MDCSSPGSSVHGIFQTRILEWVAISSSGGSPQPRDWNYISWGSCIAGKLFTTEPQGKAPVMYYHCATMLLSNVFCPEANRKKKELLCSLPTLLFFSWEYGSPERRKTWLKSPGASVVKNPPASAGDTRDQGSSSGLGISPGEGNGNLLQYSCLEKSIDRGA